MLLGCILIGSVDFSAMRFRLFTAPPSTSAGLPPVTKQVVCVKWGIKYDATYVNRLYAMVRRNLTPPFRFVCLTDSRAGIRPEVECFDLPELGCPHPEGTSGKWKKVVLWGREVPGL